MKDFEKEILKSLGDKSMAELESKASSFEKKHCKQCNLELRKSYEQRYGVCDRCQAPEEYTRGENEDDGLFRKSRVFEYIE